MASPTCHGLAPKIFDEGKPKLVLAGNPNVGKSVFFNHFTGIYVDVSNYPGTTLDISSGRWKDYIVIDTPGIYGLSSFNDEERIARDVILQADLVVNVVNATSLEKDLFLTQQIIDTGVPMVVVLNMVDEATRKGIHVDVSTLERLLGVPVIRTIAVKKQGFADLDAAVAKAQVGNADPSLREQVKALAAGKMTEGEALLALEGDEAITSLYGLTVENKRDEIYGQRRQQVNGIVAEAVQRDLSQASFTTKLGHWMVRPVTGVPMLLLTLFLMYQLVGVFIAGDVVGVTEEEIMLGYYEPFIKGVVSPLIPEESVLGTILIGEFGLLTMTPIYILGLLLPLVVGFYLFLSTLEDSGYLPRIAALVDRVLGYLGLNGRAVIPLILGFGCVTLATVTTRLLASEREKRIAIFLLGLVIPCSAQLGVIAGLLAGIGWEFVLLYVTVVLAILVTVGMALDKVLPGRSSDLLIELPPIRLPRPVNVLKKTAIKSYAFLKEAFPIFALGALIISVMQVTNLLTLLQEALSPLTVNWLGLPKEAATAFIMGIVRRDFGAAGLSEMTLEPWQTVVALLTITLFVPCIASIMVIFKERSKKEALVMWFSTWVIAFLMGGLVAQLYMGTHSVVGVILYFIGIMAAILGGLHLWFRKAVIARTEGRYHV